jgi:hypothetical protein
MFRKAYILVIPFCLLAFQNCSSGGSSNTNSSAGAQGFTPLLQDSMTDIQSFEFFHEGGLTGPGVITSYDLSLVYDQSTQTASASVLAVNGANSNICSIMLTNSDITNFLTNLQSAYLALDGSMAVIVDAGDYHFITHLNNGTSQEYLFQGGDNSHSSVVIFGQALRTQLSGFITSLNCQP